MSAAARTAAIQLIAKKSPLAVDPQHRGSVPELFGINVFKVREIMVMPPVTAVAGAPPHLLGMANIRGQVIPVIDLAGAVGCVPKNGLNILMVTEYARSTQGFAVEEVDQIVRLEWRQVLSAESSTAGGMITSIARLDGDVDNSRLAQVLDVESILRTLRDALGQPKSYRQADIETGIAALGRHLCFSHFVDGEKWQEDGGALIRKWIDYVGTGSPKPAPGWLVVGFLCVVLTEPADGTPTST